MREGFQVAVELQAREGSYDTTKEDFLRKGINQGLPTFKPETPLIGEARPGTVYYATGTLETAKELRKRAKETGLATSVTIESYTF